MRAVNYSTTSLNDVLTCLPPAVQCGWVGRCDAALYDSLNHQSTGNYTCRAEPLTGWAGGHARTRYAHALYVCLAITRYTIAMHRTDSSDMQSFITAPTGRPYSLTQSLTVLIASLRIAYTSYIQYVINTSLYSLAAMWLTTRRQYK